VKKCELCELAEEAAKDLERLLHRTLPKEYVIAFIRECVRDRISQMKGGES